MQKKFELALETGTTFFGIKMYRIRALISFSFIKQGELGGYVEKDNNLNQHGNAWVSGDAQVYGNARVSGDAQVYGDARVSGNAQVYGNARVSGDAQVYGNARVSGDAWVSGDARVYGNAQVSKFYQSCVITNLRFSLTSLPKGIQVGCHFLSMKDWKNQYKNIAARESLSPELAEAYYHLALALRRVQRIEAKNDK
jgi:carbonic anhydrase/acetyltransferase-like protein (isoleucine patch superfamily)